MSEKYSVQCFEIDTNTKFTVQWDKNDLALAEFLCRSGGLGIIEGIGYVYDLKTLGDTMKRVGAEVMNSFYKGQSHE